MRIILMPRHSPRYALLPSLALHGAAVFLALELTETIGVPARDDHWFEMASFESVEYLVPKAPETDRKKKVSPRLELRAAPGPVLIQPRFTPRLQPVEFPPLPAVLFWSAPDVEPPKPPSRPFVSPGHSRPAKTRLLDAPPRIDLPNRETRAGPRNIASGPVLPEPASLPVEASTTTPIRLPGPPPASGAAGITLDRLPGAPSNLLAFSPNPAPPAESIRVPQQTQLGSAYGAGEAASENITGPRIFDDGALVIDHPDRSTFDIVVVQSSPDDAFPESDGLLEGRPVYTAYLQVGPGREWVLQYCLRPGSRKQPEDHGMVIRLADAPTVRAPYPRRTVLPPPVVRSRTDYALIQGDIGPNGRFANLRAVKADGETFLPYLEEWRFRPATLNGSPVQIAAVLIIPPSGNLDLQVR